MAQDILINMTSREVRVALLEEGILHEVHIERRDHQGVLGNIYKGRVTRVLSGIQAAFIDIGLSRTAFLYAGDIQENASIGDLVRAGQELLVQVVKDPIGTKGARVSVHFSIPSRYLVLTPGKPTVAVSQKITDESMRTALMQMIEPDDQCGFIFRTAALHATVEDIHRDKQFLESLWTEIEERAKKAAPGTLVYGDASILLRVMRDLVSKEVASIRIDHREGFDELVRLASKMMPSWVDRIHYYESSMPIFDVYSVEKELEDALSRKVYLKSGGYLVFDQTEAMTTIDVNSGSFISGKNVDQTILKTNLEAVNTIAIQVRLRNLGGIIIIDFIDMKERTHQREVLQRLLDAFSKDHARVNISELSRLGLVQMTRKRTRESLEHVLCMPCPLCQKRGSVKSYETICYDILRDIKRSADQFSWKGFLVLANEKIIRYLEEKEAHSLSEIEEALQKSVRLKVEPSYSLEQFDILPLSE